MPASEVIGPQGSDELHNSLAQLVYYHPIQESTMVDSYNARLLQMVSSVLCPGDFDWAETGGWGDSRNVI